MMSGITSGTPAATREPLGGYNHNIRYHERIYHVQTEDSGLARPHILTHLFLDGMIVASLRTDYSELISAPDNEAVVREIMQEQHKQIMKMLRRGDLDERIDELQAPAPKAPESELPPEFAPAPPSSPRVVTVPDTTTEQRGCVTLVDFPPVLDSQLMAAIAKQQQQRQQQAEQPTQPPQPPQPSPPAAVAEPAIVAEPAAPQPPAAAASLQIPAGIDLPDSPPESIELEPLAEAAQMIDPAQVADQITAPAAEAIVLTPPPERVVNRQEARSIRRGQAISREIRIPTDLREQHATPEVGQRIDLDHPAFSAFPMLEWDGSDDGALDLDLEAINNLDLDAEPRRLDSQQLQAIELELEMPPEPLPAPRSPSEREAAGAALTGDPMASMSRAAEPRRSSSPSWGGGAGAR